MKLPDVQANQPNISVSLSSVGITGVKKHIKLAREQRDPVVLISEFDISVDLPAKRKGANLSRNLEGMNKVLEKVIEEPVIEVEGLCAEVAKEILNRHEYAKNSNVKMKSEYAIEREAPASGLESQEIVGIFAEANATEEKVLNKVGARVEGMTACPCAQEIMAEEIKESLVDKEISKDMVSELLKEIPIATHNQIGVGEISIEVSEDYFVPIERLVRIIKDSMSSEIYELLKREDEAAVIEKGLNNPVFVEDSVRKMAALIVDRFDGLPDDAMVSLRQDNKESIHSHDAFAEKKSRLGEIRKEIK